MKKVITILALLVVLILAFIVVPNNIEPKNLGVVNGKLSEMPKTPNAVSSQTDMEEKRVEPLDFVDDLYESKRRILGIVSNYKGAKIITNEEYYIHAVFKSDGLKFKDDVEFYFDDKNKVIHYRSASRVGYSDLGVNKKRYEEIRDEYYK